MASTQTIGTHNGTFHCDEALACFMLRRTDAYKNWDVTRTRDRAVLDTLPIVVDVGDVYDPAKLRFDHHQRGFAETFSAEHKTKLSSAGLIYKHFGREILRAEADSTVSDEDVDVVYNKVYKNFIEALDGIDNGISQYPKDIEPAYTNNTDLSARVGRLNPSWNEDTNDADRLERFHKAMELAGTEFLGAVRSAFQIWLPARDIVKKALMTRTGVDSSQEVIKLERYTTWQSHIFTLEEEMKISPPISYVLFPDTSGNAWRIQAVSIRKGSFVSRKALPEAWRGVRGKELDKASGIDGCVFCHHSGFIGGNATYDGVLSMARRSLKIFQENAAAADENVAKKQKV